MMNASENEERDSGLRPTRQPFTAAFRPLTLPSTLKYSMFYGKLKREDLKLQP